MSALKKGDHLYLVDGSGYLFRAYHALPPLTRKSDGLPTGAVAGYCNMLWKLLEDMKGGDKPSHLAVIFDAGKTTFRNKIYPQYKANRPEPPEENAEGGFMESEVDPILDKISAHGIQSLTARERQILEAARKHVGRS